MSYIVTKYPQGTFCWAILFSTDIQASTKFLDSLFGWKSELLSKEREPEYVSFSLEGKHVAGGSIAYDPSAPSFWSSYISVDNVDEMASRAEQLGAKITIPPIDTQGAGRMATIIDPTGAAVSLWQPKKHIGAEIVNTFGATTWNELYTHDVEKAKKFYADLLGWTYEIDAANDNYVTIKNNGRSNGGIYNLSPEMSSMPPNWTVYFHIENIENAVAKVKELGGQVYMQKDIAIGEIAMVADPAEGSFMLLEMSVPPEEWKE